MELLSDPSTSAYKKARRQHLKTTRKREHTADLNWTPFRAAEKRYKARFPPPDLSQVLDLATLYQLGADGVANALWSSVGVRELALQVAPNTASGSQAKVRSYAISRIPGLVLLPGFVSSDEQRHLLRWSLRDHARSPNDTNLDVHYILPQDGVWNAYLAAWKDNRSEVLVQPRLAQEHQSPLAAGPRKLIDNVPVAPDNYLSLSASPKDSAAPSPTARPSPPSVLIPKLRWANIGWSYHWGSKQYDFAKGRVSVESRVSELCKRAVGSVPWQEVFARGDDISWSEWRSWANTYEPDAGIVNFYQTKDTLMAHVDRSEVCATSPLVSISLGNAAIFLIGGVTRDVEPVAILLRSGDAIIMSGPACRRAYHGVPRILENTSPSHFQDDSDPDWEPYAAYIQTARININVRQVFPKGFDPSIVAGNL